VSRIVRLAAVLMIAGIGTALAQSARVHPKAASIVDRYVEGTGGRGAFEAQHDVYIKGRIRSMGMAGTFEQWTRRPDRMVQRIRVGPLRIRRGYDGTMGWETDLNSKKVRILDGKDLEAIQSEAWFENEAWAAEDFGGAALMPGGTSYRHGRRYRSVDIAPPVGPSRQLWFDDETGALDRIVSRRDHHEWKQWAVGTIPAGGRSRHRSLTSEAPSADGARPAGRDPDQERWEERLDLDSVRVNHAVPDSIFSPPGLAARRVAWRKATGRIDVPFRYGTRHVWIKASINGAPPADFLLDTGCSITAIDRTYADHIGLRAEGSMAVQGISGTDEGSFARISSLSVRSPSGSRVSVQDLKVGLIDLGESFESVLWRPVAGLIGYDFLNHFVVRIDYDRGIVTLTDPKKFAYEGSAEPIPMRLFSGIPTVEATINGGCAGEFVVDCGNAFGLDVHGSMVRRCRLLSRASDRRQVEVYSGGIGGATINWFSRLDSVQIGGLALAEPIAGLTLGSRGLIGSRDYAGNIGNAVLERFVVTIDYERRRLYLEPGRRYRERDRLSCSGAFLFKSEDRVLAGQIIRGSAAHSAGLKLLDVVTTIDGKPAASYTPEELDRMFVRGEEGASHTLVVERDGEQRTLMVKLKDVL
jgi:Aspartyl protease/PDZ domain